MIAFLSQALVSLTFTGALEYQCVDASGNAKYLDHLCAPEERCLKWGAHGWSEDACAPEMASVRKAAATKAKADTCRADLQCWADKLHPDATVECRPRVEARAKYQFRWEDGWLEQKFDRIAWGDRSAGTVVFSGSHISMQNGFGSWQRMAYFCTFDPTSGRVTDLEVRPF